mmetsp:Transcript_6449/g.11530  ORF Transcript_6449/g.11530 Transcript_6449/m.11530 type:complete len:102 (-) Transcript_6449:991-1296(-)
MKKILVLLSFSVAAQAAEIINEARLEKLLDDSIELDGEPSSPSRPLLRAEECAVVLACCGDVTNMKWSSRMTASCVLAGLQLPGAEPWVQMPAPSATEELA